MQNGTEKLINPETITIDITNRRREMNQDNGERERTNEYSLKVKHSMSCVMLKVLLLHSHFDGRSRRSLVRSLVISNPIRLNNK